MRISIEERFWSKVDKRGENDCWNWTASTSEGYGQFHLDGKLVYAHRIALYGFGGEDSPNLYDGYFCAAHTCDNPLCVNPRHLFICSNAGNNLDKALKGRAARQKGEANGSAKLTEKEMISIKEILAHGIGTHKEIGDHFGVDRTTISRIKTGARWAHV